MPIRPMNINTIMTHLPIVDNSDVIPIDVPVVPNAEVTSKIISKNEKLSVTLRMIIELEHNRSAVEITIKALIMSSLWISRENTFTLVWPLA